MRGLTSGASSSTASMDMCRCSCVSALMAKHGPWSGSALLLLLLPLPLLRRRRLLRRSGVLVGSAVAAAATTAAAGGGDGCCCSCSCCSLFFFFLLLVRRATMQTEWRRRRVGGWAGSGLSGAEIEVGLSSHPPRRRICGLPLRQTDPAKLPAASFLLSDRMSLHRVVDLSVCACRWAVDGDRLEPRTRSVDRHTHARTPRHTRSLLSPSHPIPSPSPSRPSSSFSHASLFLLLPALCVSAQTNQSDQFDSIRFDSNRPRVEASTHRDVSQSIQHSVIINRHTHIRTPSTCPSLVPGVPRYAGETLVSQKA